MRRYIVPFLFALSICVVGCSSDDGKDSKDTTPPAEDVSNDETEEDTEEQDASEKDTGNQETTEDTSTDSAQSDTAEQDSDEGSSDIPDITTLALVSIGQNCPTSSCANGIEVNINSEDITKLQAGGSSPSKLQESDLEALKENIFTPTLADKMKNGWSCGDMQRNSNNTKFELRAELPQADPTTRTAIVTGCLTENSEQPDAEHIKRIRDRYWNLREKYFQ